MEWKQFNLYCWQTREQFYLGKDGKGKVRTNPFTISCGNRRGVKVYVIYTPELKIAGDAFEGERGLILAQQACEQYIRENNYEPYKGR